MVESIPPQRSPSIQKWTRIAILVIGAITVFGFAALRPILGGYTKRDHDAAVTHSGTAIVQQIILSPLIIPGVVTGVSLLSLLSAAGMRIGLFGLCLGMLVFALPFSIRALSANLLGLDPRIEEAARNLGAGPVRTFFSIVLPQLKSGILAASVFVFVEALDNFSIAVFLTNDSTKVLPVAAYQYIKDFDDPTVAAMATALIVMSVVIVAFLEKVMGFQKSLRL